VDAALDAATRPACCSFVGRPIPRAGRTHLESTDSRDLLAAHRLICSPGLPCNGCLTLRSPTRRRQTPTHRDVLIQESESHAERRRPRSSSTLAQSRVRCGRDPVARPGDRRQHDDLFRRQLDPPPASAGRSSRATALRLDAGGVRRGLLLSHAAARPRASRSAWGGLRRIDHARHAACAGDGRERTATRVALPDRLR